MLYTLRTECPVSWTAHQEKNLMPEYPWSDVTPREPSQYVSQTYLQFLWLPESIVPLGRLKAAMLRVCDLLPSNSVRTRFPDRQVHPLHELLSPILLTTRQCTEKWDNEIPSLLAAERSSGGLSDELMWFNIRNARMDEPAEDEAADAHEEQWRVRWLQRMERREIMIQIILYFLLLSVPGPPTRRGSKPAKARSTSAPSPSPKKKVAVSVQHAIPLDDRLEAFMDRLSMWQLVDTIEDSAGGNGSLHQSYSGANRKGKGKEVDERDWGQAFCEDVVQPLFQSVLPEQYDLLHDKVFPVSPFDDDSDSSNLVPTPPASPKSGNQRTHSLSNASSYSQGTARPQKALSRSGSTLSASLQEERVRERSKSLSVGPGGLRKRALTREISMSTNFKNKNKAGASTAREKDKRPGKAAEQSKRAPSKKDQGVTLVEATPANRQEKHGRARTGVNNANRGAKGRDVLPSMLSSSQMAGQSALEGDDDDDEWTLDGSPDVMLLESKDEDDTQGGWQATPSKKPKARRKLAT